MSTMTTIIGLYLLLAVLILMVAFLLIAVDHYKGVIVKKNETIDRYQEAYEKLKRGS